MKRFFAIMVSLLLVCVVYITLPPASASHDTLAVTSDMMHQFLNYETTFGALNNSNFSKTGSGSKALLILQFAEAEAELNKSLKSIQTHLPLTQGMISSFFEWEKEQQKKLLSGQYLQYWQVTLLKTQLKLAKLLNDSDSESDFNILRKVKIYKTEFQKKTPAELCELLKNFGETTDTEQLAKQIAIIELGKIPCEPGV